MNGQLSLRSVAFLDTNTLHYIGIYLEFAKEHNLFPLASVCQETDNYLNSKNKRRFEIAKKVHIR